MSEAKHTPGPWAIYVPNSLSNDDMAYGIDTDKGTESESVVLFYGGILKKEDARLIAAAPDLLEALQRARSEIWSLLDSKGVHPKHARNWPEILAADSAIAKATGKTQ